MVKRRARRPVTLRRTLKPGFEKRIRIPQPPTRPIQLHQRDLVQRNLFQESPWWQTLHRRGPKRLRAGMDPLEARAVSKSEVPGTLPERIMYLALIRVLRMVPDADFDFQSSQQGGRLEFGGIVADFVVFQHMTIINPLGPTHSQFLRIKKDDEQKGILEEMGYRVLLIEEEDIYNEFYLESWLRRNFGLRGSRGGNSGGALGPHDLDETESLEPYLMEAIWAEVQKAENTLDELFIDLPNLMS